ncbi:uncharacterized protein LOC134539635 [Bacillus rossius redtenbacheri]|uniref:uncharacterized protein LOC134539635 n=1 Tax=Bacillus rossius redtenbacheri TaxID=93214 RepID=UPI002FDCB048
MQEMSSSSGVPRPVREETRVSGGLPPRTRVHPEIRASSAMDLGLFLVMLAACGLVGCQLLAKVHQTYAAAEKANDLSCYTCHAMDTESACLDLVGNMSGLVTKCQGENRTCMVKRFSYTTSTENSTSAPHMWSLQRNCSERCEPGCIVIGERTKLYACTACCFEPLCNNGTGEAMPTVRPAPYLAMLAGCTLLAS